MLAGSMIATVSAWAVMPVADVFDTGLAGRFASAMQQADDDCLATSMLIDGGSMLVMLDERGGVTEIELGAMPARAEGELRMAMSGQFAGAMTAISPDALVCSAMGAIDEEEEVEVQVEVVNGAGTIVIERNGERREMEIDLDEIAAEMDEAGVDMHALMGRLMHEGKNPWVHTEVVVEMVDDDGEHHRRRFHIGEDEGGDHEERMMMFMGDPDARRMPGRDPHGGQGMGHLERSGRESCPMCGRGVGGMGPRGMHGPSRPFGAQRGHDDMQGHPGMGEGHGDMGADMLREHMHFLREMHEDPERAWEIIESLPPEMRREHEELLGQLMGDHHGDDGDFFGQAGQFVEKVEMARHVAQRLDDAEAMAIFGVWQVREHLEPEARIALLSPMVANEQLLRSVRNAASFVMMEALGEADEEAAAIRTLQEMILRNGEM
jgi:hypothetical protein